MPEGVDELIARHHDGDLDADGLERLVAALEADPQARRAFRQELRLTAGLQQEAGLRAQAGTNPRAGGSPAVPGRASRRTWLRAGIIGGGLAAAAAIAVAIFMPGGVPEGKARFNGAVVAPGATVRGNGSLSWHDGSVAVLQADSELRLEAGERRAVLLGGSLAATVAHQASGSAFVVDAGPVSLRALGTRFELRTGAGGTRAAVEEGIVSIANSAEPQLAVLLYPGESWSSSSTWSAGAVTRNQAALTAARKAGRVVDGLLADLRFDEGAGGIVHDRAGVSPTMDLSLAAGAGTWEKGGLTLTARDGLRWRGDSTRIRQALAGGGLTIEIAWNGAAAPGRIANLLELGGDLDEDAVAITVTPADTLHHLIWRLGSDGLDIVADGIQILHRGGAGSEVITRSHRVLGRDELLLALRGISYAADAERAERNSGAPWRVTYRRVSIYGRVLTLEEIRRNALADETARSGR